MIRNYAQPSDALGALAKGGRQQLVQPGMQLVVRGEHLALRNRTIGTAIVGDEAAGFLDQQIAGRDVPRLQSAFPEGVEPARRDPGEIERGGAQAAQDLAAGNAQMMFSASLEAKPLLDSGKTRAIAISSLTRSPAFPAIPTVAEVTDMPDFQAIFWQAMVVPAGTPKPIADKLQAAIAKVAADPEVIERFKLQGVEIRSSTSRQGYPDREEDRRCVAALSCSGIRVWQPW